jgi:hypothetical protein
MNNDIEGLYRRGQQESPPAALDKLLLNQARESCENKASKHLYFKQWLLPLSTAAVLVLSFVLMLNLQDQQQAIQTLPLPATDKTEIQVDLIEYRDEERKARQRAMPAKRNASETSKPAMPDVLGEMDSVNSLKITPEMYKKPDKEELKLTPEEIMADTVAVLNSYQIAIEPDQETVKSDNTTLAKKLRNKEKPKRKLEAYTAPVQSIQEQQKKPETTGSIAALEDSNIPEVNATEQDDVNITVPGSRIYDLPKKLERKLKKLQQLIDKRKIKKAKQLLKKLKEKYPDYDYTEFEKLLEQS